MHERRGAFNTFVLICSSLTVVLAHWCLHTGDVKKATLYIAGTLALGCVFLVVKAFEYKAKFEPAWEDRFLVYQNGPLTCLRTVLALGCITRR